MASNIQSNGLSIDDYFVRREFFRQGNLWGWGNGSFYGLGVNSTSEFNSPIQTAVGGLNWKQASSGGYFGGGTKTDGTLWMWGRNTNYQVGSGNGYATHNSTPAQVAGGGSTWKKVACGYDHAIALKTNGTIWVWGSNNNYQNGSSSTSTRYSTPVQYGSETTWKDVGASQGGGTVGGIKTDGTLWMWGENAYGKLGAGFTGDRSSPVQFGTGTWKTFDVNIFHSAAIKTDGTLWAAGAGMFGAIGDGTTTNRINIVQVAGGGTTWKQVSCGRGHTVAIKTDGTLWGWGDNGNGALGTNNTTSCSTPVQTIAAGTAWKQVGAGSYHTAAIKADGSLWLWGDGGSGKLGNSSSISRSSPVQIAGGGNNWVFVKPGVNKTFAIVDI